MKKIYYNENGWVCKRYPNDLAITDENRFIEVDESEYQKTLITASGYAWKVANGQLVNAIYDDNLVQKLCLQNEFEEIQTWLKENDWKPNKIITGEWQTFDTRWQTYLAERKAKRSRQDEILAQLNN